MASLGKRADSIVGLPHESVAIMERDTLRLPRITF